MAESAVVGGAGESPEASGQHQAFAVLARPGVFYSLLVAAVVVVFCAYYRRWPGTHAFTIPLWYMERGDALYTLGASRAFSEFPAPWDLHIGRLDAPFGADWNDYPHSEKLVFYVSGLLRRFFDAGVAANLAVLLNQAASAATLAWTARRFGARPAAAFAAGMLFAFNPFMTGRGLGHLNVAYVWHVPLLLFALRQVTTLERLPSRRDLVASAVLAVAMATQNPYYTVLFLQLFAVAALAAGLRGRWAGVRYGLLLLVVGAGTFVLGQLNVFLRSWAVGPNPEFQGRNLGAILRWGLRLPDLILPDDHPIKVWSDFAQRHYFGGGNPGTENGMAFLGIVGILALLALVLVAARRGIGGRLDDVPWHAWVLAYVLFFALAGGGDYLLGSFGMTWLRAANRFSIVILALALLFAAEGTSRIVRAGVVASTSLTCVVVAILEMFGMQSDAFAQWTALAERRSVSDRDFGRELERRLPVRAAVFQLPVMGFPEERPIEEMNDYEHFRPYIWTDQLRFSYGTHKGREREAWQRHAVALVPKELVAYLGKHGFDAIMVNRRGFKDRGKELEGALAESGSRLVESADRELVAYRIARTGSVLPREYPSMGLFSGFPRVWDGNDEHRSAWSDGDARLGFTDPLTKGKRYQVSFEVDTLIRRPLKVRVGGRQVASLTLVPHQKKTVEFTFTAEGGRNLVELDTEEPDNAPDSADPRLLGFRIFNPTSRVRRR